MNIYYVAAIWLGMALLASAVSIRIAIPAALVEIVIGAPVRPSPLWSRAWQWSTFARHAQRVRSSLPLCGGGASARGPRDSCWRRREVIKEQ
jgi:predicted exporter